MRHLSIIIPLLLAAAPAAADSRLSDLVCDDRNRIEDQLKNVVGAEKQGHGMRGPDALLAVWITPRSGSWTLVQSYANGTACIVAMGDHWEDLRPDPDPA